MVFKILRKVLICRKLVSIKLSAQCNYFYRLQNENKIKKNPHAQTLHTFYKYGFKQLESFQKRRKHKIRK